MCFFDFGPMATVLTLVWLQDIDLALAAVQSLQGGLGAGAVEMDVEDAQVVEQNPIEERLLKRARRMHR